MRRSRKAFTILELVIVIGIMVTLAGILIPTFVTLSSAQSAADDKSFVKKLNSELALEETTANTTNATFGEAIKIIEDRGYTVDNLRLKSNDTLLWNEIDNRFVLESEKDKTQNDTYYWTIADSYDENNQKYSLYATNNLENTEILNLATGFEVGKSSNIKKISYVRSSTLDEQTAKIVTDRGVDLEINAPNDVVRHYGAANNVNIIATKSSSYHEYGAVKKVTLSEGRYILEKTSSLEKLVLSNTDIIFGTTLKRLLPNISVEGARKVHLQVNNHHYGKVLADTYAYIDNDGHFILTNTETDERIEPTTKNEDPSSINNEENGNSSSENPSSENSSSNPSHSELSSDVENENTTNPVDEEPLKERDITIKQLTDSEVMCLNMMRKHSINGSISGSLKADNNTYKVNGTLILNNREFEEISYQLDLSISNSSNALNVRITHISDSYYVSLNNRHYLLEKASLKTLLNMINDIQGPIKFPAEFLSLVASQVKQKFNGMRSETKGDEIVYTCRLLDDMNPIIFKSDLDYNLKSMSISNLESDGFSFNVDVTVNNLGTGKIELLPDDYSYLSLNFASLETSTRNGIVNTLRNIFTTNTAGVHYDVKVTRDNKLTFSSIGKFNVSSQEDNGERDVAIRLSGNMKNANSDLPLDSDFDIALLNDNVYFSYQNRLKLKYTRAGIEGLIDIIKTRLIDDNNFQDFAEQFMPDNSSKDAPLFDILFTSHNYKELLRYFSHLSKEDGNLVIHFDSSLLNADDGDITFTINTTSNGLGKIALTNVYAYGYYINGEFEFEDYENIVISDPNSYTSLDYINNAFDEIFDLFGTKKAHLALNATITKNGETTKLNGSTHFQLTDSENWGVGALTIKDKDNKTHNITIDVTKKNVSKDATEQQKDAAFAASQILFNYNNNLKGYFSISSITDVYDLIYQLVQQKDERFMKYEEYLLSDLSRSTLLRLARDEIESILYNDMITDISLANNTYTIKLNGNFLKKNNLYKCDYIYVDVKLDDNHDLQSITVRSDNLLDYKFNITLELKAWDNNYSRLTKTSDYKDFSDLKTLAEYLLNTAKRNDYHVSGTFDLTLAFDFYLFETSPINLTNIPMDAYVHIEKDSEGKEKVYSCVEIDVPYYSTILQNSSKWKERKFYIFFTDTEVYLLTKTRTGNDSTTKKEYTKEYAYKKLLIKYYNYKGYETKWNENKYTTQNVKLSMNDFFSNALYYIFNFGFDFEKDLNSYSGVNSNVDYSNIISKYSYTKGTPSWLFGLNMEELTGKDSIKQMDITLTGNKNTKEMKELDVEGLIEIISIIKIRLKLHATMDNQVISNSRLQDVKNYVNYMSNRTNKQEFGANYSIVTSSSQKVTTHNGKNEADAAFIYPLTSWKEVSSPIAKPNVGDVRNLSVSGYYVFAK